MKRTIGWKDGEQNWDFADAWDCSCDIYIEYHGHEYKICLEEDRNVYDLEDCNKVLRHYVSKEDFYSSTLFGKPIKEVIDRSIILLIR